MASTGSFGELLRQWRQRRRLSQLDLALQAEISSRHLSFLETGRSQPSREMLLHLAEQLEIPLRDRNVLLHAAGFANAFPERDLSHPSLEVVRKAVDVVLAAHRPYPAMAIDRHWNMVASNGAIAPLLGDIDPALLEPPPNVLRLTLHPGGLAPRLGNYNEWRLHVFDNLRREIAASADPVLVDLLEELRGYPAPNRTCAATPAHSGGSAVDPACHRFVVPFQLRTGAGLLSFFSTTTVFGTPVDITLSELSIESFYPADAATAEAFRKLDAASPQRRALTAIGSAKLPRT